jgi:hypothetical protein
MLIASLDRAGDHAALLGMLVMVAVVGALVYGLYLLVKRRADRSGSDRGRDELRGPEA